MRTLYFDYSFQQLQKEPDNGLVFEEIAPDRFTMTQHMVTRDFFTKELKRSSLTVSPHSFSQHMNLYFNKETADSEVFLSNLLACVETLNPTVTPQSSASYHRLTQAERFEEARDYCSSELDVNLSEEKFEALTKLYLVLFPIFGAVRNDTIFNDNFYHYFPIFGYYEWQSAPSWKELVTEAFGVHRKDLSKICQEASSYTFPALVIFSKVLPIDKIILLANEVNHKNCTPGVSDVEELESVLSEGLLAQLTRLPEKTTVRLVREFLSEPARGDDRILSIKDTLVMLTQVNDEDLKRFHSDKSWSEVHRRAASYAHEENVDEKLLVPLPKQLQAINETIVSVAGIAYGIKMLVAPLDFNRVGGVLNICIGKAGYYGQAMAGESYCLVMESAHELIAVELAFPLGNFTIKQLVGANNSRPALYEELKSKLHELFEEENTVKSNAPPKVELVSEEFMEDLRKKSKKLSKVIEIQLKEIEEERKSIANITFLP